MEAIRPDGCKGEQFVDLSFSFLSRGLGWDKLGLLTKVMKYDCCIGMDDCRIRTRALAFGLGGKGERGICTNGWSPWNEALLQAGETKPLGMVLVRWCLRYMSAQEESTM